MPFQVRVQPVDDKSAPAQAPTIVGKPAGKPSRLKRLFERQFPGVLRIPLAEKLGAGGDRERENEAAADAAVAVEPNSVCLDKMIQSFMEDTDGGGERPARCARNRCNCFHACCTDSQVDDIDFKFFDLAGGDPLTPLVSDASELLKGLVPCVSVAERNILAEVLKIVEKNKLSKGKIGCLKILAVELQSLGYDASVCKSRWEKSAFYPAGEYEYVDVVMDGGDRFLVDVEFRSEFEMARSTKVYRGVVQSLPLIFVGKPDRLQQIVAVVCEAACQSLKRKGLSFPPWRKPEYMRAKWLSPYSRADAAVKSNDSKQVIHPAGEGEAASSILQEENSAADSHLSSNSEEAVSWQPPAVRPRTGTPGAKVVRGLASMLNDQDPDS